MICEHCGEVVLTQAQRRYRERLALGLCLDCGLNTDGQGQRCAICREKKNAARRKTEQRRAA